MYFKKLELFGFKSFAEKTTLHFEPGITAVVGPNGCGKSNIADSIRWVLGEQSVKSLRGTKMEDVIFNGTESIPALGYAEASLTFSNETKALAPVRGLAINYDEVTVTRRLFRSGESEYLLNKTPVRLKDILELFMGTGIGAESYSLIEQGKIDLILSSRPEDRRLVFDEAAGISKYKSHKRETIRKLEDTEANLLRINDIIAEVRRQINSLERQAAKARRYKEVFERLKQLETAVSSSQLKRSQEQLAKLTQELGQLESRQASDTQEIERLNNTLSSRRQELTLSEENLNNLRSQLRNLENTVSRNDQQRGFNRERTGELKLRLETIAKQKEELSVKISQDEARLNTLRVEFDLLAQELEQKKSLSAKAQSKLEEISNTIAGRQIYIAEAKKKVMGFAAEEARLNNRMRELASSLNQALARKKRLDMEKEKTGEELTVIQDELTSATCQQDEAYQKLLAYKKEYQALKALYQESVQEKEALVSRINSLENEESALSSQKEFLCNLKLRYENITESSNAYILLDSLAPEKISGMIIKVTDIQNAVESDSAIFNPARFKLKGTAKPISLDPQEIIDKIDKLGQEIMRAKNVLSDKVELTLEFYSKLSSTEEALRKIELEYNSSCNRKDNIRKQYDKLKEELELVGLESKETVDELNQLNVDERQSNAQHNELKARVQANQEAIDTGLEEITAQNNLKEETLLVITQVKTEIRGGEEKVLGSLGTYKVLEEVCRKDKSALSSLEEEETSSSVRIQELDGSFKALAAEIDNAYAQKGLLEKEADGISGGLAQIKNNLKDLEDAISGRKDCIDQNKTKIHGLKMQQQELTFQQNGIYERIEQIYKVDADTLRNSSAGADCPVEEAACEIELLKTKLESYGQVNLVAIEEFEELKQRFDFLSQQQADLLRAKESLHEAILKINRTTKKMFLETFEKLAVEFKNYFRLLFGGGDGQLFLIDEQDVLESGIEIVCRPPGKKLQNVLLLSGGEKSMAAIALLFAIFKVKPSPFCVLDEIDAALDESNVDRFGRMLADFTSQSQFIVITHNKKTIANANIMYGITMEKAGISKIVSVKLAENKQGQEVESSAKNEQGQKVLEPA